MNPITENSASESGKDTKRRQRGQALRDHIRQIAQEIEEREGSPPSYAQIHREHGYAIKTIAKHLPRRSRKRRMKPTSSSEAPVVEFEAQTPELVAQMVAELVFGCDLVPGTFVNTQGVLRCDGISETAEGMEPMVQRWRLHEAEVAQILLAARQLA